MTKTEHPFTSTIKDLNKTALRIANLRAVQYQLMLLRSSSTDSGVPEYLWDRHTTVLHNMVGQEGKHYKAEWWSLRVKQARSLVANLKYHADPRADSLCGLAEARLERRLERVHSARADEAEYAAKWRSKTLTYADDKMIGLAYSESIIDYETANMFASKEPFELAHSIVWVVDKLSILREANGANYEVLANDTDPIVKDYLDLLDKFIDVSGRCLALAGVHKTMLLNTVHYMNPEQKGKLEP